MNHARIHRRGRTPSIGSRSVCPSRCIILAGLSAAAGLATPCLAQTQEQRLLPSDPLTSDIFGYDVAFDGADTFFPAFDRTQFVETARDARTADDGTRYAFVSYRRPA